LLQARRSDYVDIIDKQEPNMYASQLYIGKDFLYQRVVLDTLNDWTLISNNYDIAATNTTARKIEVTDANNQTTQKSDSIWLEHEVRAK